MRIVCVSDTHMAMSKISLPDGDILVHTGDLTFRGTVQEMTKELSELGKHRDKYKAIIHVSGNHDWLSEKQPGLMEQLCRDEDITYLCDSEITVGGLRFYGSPVQLFFCNWAWNRHPGADIQKHWDKIPNGIDVLLSHGPAYGVLDWVPYFNNKKGEMDVRHCGCPQLLKKILDVKPKAFIFGHIHPSAGTITQNGIQFVNASLMDDNYDLTNSPIVITL